MVFHFEHIDQDDKHWAKAMNAGGPNDDHASVRADVNRLLANMARVKKWKPFPGEIAGGQPVYIHLWNHKFPQSERMKRINAIEVKNGGQEIYTAKQIADADKAGLTMAIAMHDKDGKELPPILVSPIARQSSPEIVAMQTPGDLAQKTIVIQEMAGAGPTVPGTDGTTPPPPIADR